MGITRAELVELHNRVFLAEYKRLMAIPVAPPVAPNAKVIAKWPTKENSALTGIGRLFPGPRQSYRVW